MAKTLNEMKKEVHVAEIVNHGEKMILPSNMTLDEGIDLLKRRKSYMEEDIRVHEVFDAFPWDGAHALDVVLTRRYGWSPAEAVPGFFGKAPPTMISIQTNFKETKQVPWGRFSLPGVEGYIDTGSNRKNGRVVFSVTANILRKDEEAVKALFADLRQELEHHSIYRGKAFKMRFRDDDGDVLGMPEPQFIDTTDIDENMLVYSKDVQSAIETNLFTPIRRVEDCVANNIPVKRGVLLGGPYGTGKTLAAKVASKLAVENGVTYVYVQRADELADAVAFAKQYSDPACVIFCEDIDRAMDGERSTEMDDILNIIDGIDTKSSNIIVVLTSNHLENINPAMLRPGRLDAVINVLPPDADAVNKLIRYYGGSAVDADTDISSVCKKLEGRIPAVISEVVKRAKLAQMALQPKGTIVTQITAEALNQAADTMADQLELLYKDRAQQVPSVDSILASIISQVVDGKLADTVKQVQDIHDETC